MADTLDPFRRALAGAARAIAKDPEVEVVFASDVVPPSGKTARVPSPGSSLEPKLVAEADRVGGREQPEPRVRADHPVLVEQRQLALGLEHPLDHAFPTTLSGKSVPNTRW